MNRFSVSLNDDLYAILVEIQRRERYRSLNEVVQSFVRHWAYSQQEHHLTGPLASEPGPNRDKIDAELRKLVETGQGKKGSWLKAIIYETIKEVCGPEAKSPTVDQVLTRLPRVARDELLGKRKKGATGKEK